MGEGSVRSVTAKLSAESDSAISADPNNYVTEDGQKVNKEYYTIYMHLYFRLNWLCKRVAKGELPKKFPMYVKRTQKEMLELTLTTVKDGNYKLVEKTIKHLKQGLEHYHDIQDMYPLMNGMNSAPWRSGEVAMKTFINEGGFGVGQSGDANSDFSRNAKNNDESTDATPQQAIQKKAIDLAIKYATLYRLPPQEMMSQEWKEAVDATRTLKVNLLGNYYNGSGGVVSSNIKDTNISPKSRDEIDPFGEDAEERSGKGSDQ